VTLDAGGFRQVAQKKNQTGYLSQSDPRLHFGLGDASLIDRIEILWPSGRTQVLENVSVNQILTVEEPNG
jgi:hypothetical protein